MSYFSFYMIRHVKTGLFICGRHRVLGTFEDAAAEGVFYNQPKNAEKRIKEENRRSSGENGFVNAEFRIEGQNGVYFSTERSLAEYKDFLKSRGYEEDTVSMQLMDFELEVVEARLQLAE